VLYFRYNIIAAMIITRQYKDLIGTLKVIVMIVQLFNLKRKTIIYLRKNRTSFCGGIEA